MKKYSSLKASGLSWLLFVGIAISAPFVLAGLIGVAYHPNANWAPMAGYRAIAIIVFFCLSLALAIRHTVTATKLTNQRIAMELLLLVASGIAVERYGRTTQHSPDTYLRYVGEVPYAFPRVFSGYGELEPGPKNQLFASYCLSSLKGRYDGVCVQEVGLPKTVGTSLSPLPITSRFNVYYALNNAEVAFTEDQILMLSTSGKVDLIELDGLVGFSYSNSAKNYFILNEASQLVVYVHCNHFAKYCSVTTKTEHGNLSFPSVGDHSLDLARWRKDEKRHMALFDSWRCDEPRCGDRITE